ncbi:MAG: DEAD/DEAH box helicase family protein [Pseudomonadota bacterium]|jgi:type I restriction enzyme R subunit|nr:DEAD/DEAH box helicase family protein [Syntrophaceae bacterium]MDI9555730.1 DEAD/DEAH box helicase family protein [Pseudomonadota bacterium]NLX32317.1 DEAD/DEAH box helicase family protein [Deltaproteobacteria bacterium]HNU84512.1 DEAD/DEAH box helicase family protein [Syntrophales bacterium]HNZ34634.1 DEAD/DEAH box helicase family protein [Syntrophales bacterium]
MTELEWQTRRDRINRKLAALKPSWEIIKFKEGLDPAQLHCHAVEEYPTANGPADYAFFVKGKLLGILEAKKVGVGPYTVLEQAKRYAKGAHDGTGNWRGYRVPFLYASNGEVIWFLDVRAEKNVSRRIHDFHTADALEEWLGRQSGYEWFGENPNAIDRLRPYQKAAIEATEAAITKGKRAMLLAMATGTGKTFMTVAQIYRFLESKAFRRVLFLVDRRALAAQAVREFAAFNTPKGLKFDKEYDVFSQRFRREDFDDDKPYDPKVLPGAYLTSPQATHTFVYVSTIQRMAINLFGREGAFSQSASDPEYDEDDTDRIDIPIHAFDAIVADECHRGYTAKDTATWRAVLDHFDAVKIGLTATPAPHTLSLFNEVVFRYTTEQAILDDYLVDYDAVRIKSNVRMNGVFLKEGEQVGLVDTQTGQEVYDQLEDEREFSSEQIEKDITAPDSNRKIVGEIARYAYAHEKETGRFPKILIFAANDLPHISHADQLVRLCREEFGQGDDFVQKITGSPSVDRPLQKIREFRNRPNPKVVVTVDMLSTGVDIPSLEFVVFMRPVKSRILWVQMLGRGTRLCPEIDKSHFTIFDCFDGTLIEYFRNTTDFDVEPPRKEPMPIEQVIENIYQNVDRDYHVRVLAKRLRRIEKEMSGEAREKFAAFIPDGDMGKFAGSLPDRIKNDFTETMKILRNKEFQELLVNYPRARKSFYKGYEVVDEVTSGVMIRRGSEYQKPEDYLDTFARFVRDNPEQIEAIRILLERPRGWKTEALDELRRTLSLNRFDEKDLQKAHRLVYNKALADIISMVKHAARQEEPILTAEERTDRAMAKVTAGKQLTGEQSLWMGLIREHLVRNLTIELADFDNAPAFAAKGGLGRARKVFTEGLETLIEQFNYAIAA